MAGIERGDIKKLLVLEALPKPVNFSGQQEPLSLGGTFTLERILGTVPVEADGSASFEVPALRSIFVVALDENDMSVKRMQSFMTIEPGETLSCVGCHEQRQSAPPAARRTQAMLRAPSKITPITDVPEVIDFPRDVQPILDKHCVGCHDFVKTEQGRPCAGGVILSGDHGPRFSISYAMLTVHKQFFDGRNGAGNRAPQTIGSSASPLMQKLDGQHFDVQLSSHEKKMIRLWIESAAAYPGTYAALGTGMVHMADGDKEILPMMQKRCIECHEKERVKINRDMSTNVTRPELSLVLLKPLSKKAGGYGMTSKRMVDGKEVVQHFEVFQSKDDPDYQHLLQPASYQLPL